MARAVDGAALVEAARAGSPRAVARLISLVEDGHPALRQIMAALAPHSGHAHVIGVTGAPGVGKSTATDALVRAFRARGDRVAVVAVDPSSPLTGGALLGDRIRMTGHALDDGVFIRSMASRGHLGGLAGTTHLAIRVLDASGYDLVLVETVGVGQSEVEIAACADTTVILLSPGMGDAVQAAKAGILEIGDLFVVNKADRDGADVTVRDLRRMIELGDRGELDPWRRPIVKTVATQEEGIDDLVVALGRHRAWLHGHGRLERRRGRRARAEVEALVMATVGMRLRAPRCSKVLEAAIEGVRSGRLDPFTAADTVIQALDHR